MRGWVRELFAGDWLMLALALGLTLASFVLLWKPGSAQRAEVRRDGQVIAQLPLDAPRRLTVQGAIGPTVVEIEPGRARIAADPGPRQYCVKQGWLTRNGAVAICAPSHVSLHLSGATPGYDTLAF